MSDADDTRLIPTASHWGAYAAELRGGRLVAMRPAASDPDPSPLARSMPGAQSDALRIRRPAARAGWLERGPGGDNDGRGRQPFVELPWDEALDLVAGELTRVREAHGNRAIYAGSYGWASAGRFHHAQSQLHRFMNLFGGYTASRDSYSYAAGEVVLPHVLGDFQELLLAHTGWRTIARHGRLVVAFGGLPARNGQVSAGGTGHHGQRQGLAACRAAGVEFVNVGPARDDMAAALGASWLAIRPGTDVAAMLGLAHTLYAECLHDAAFLDRYCTGFERFLPYLTGDGDGQAKDADWAAAICDVDAGDLRRLARRMASRRTTLALAWSLTRGQHGEQPYWMGTVLAAMLGQIGLPGGGIGFGYGSVNAIGATTAHFPWPSLDQGANPVGEAIPVARIADMLLHPGRVIDYDGRRIALPPIRLVYWAGGNPFHHHQDLNRLLAAWRRPDTAICNESWWNPLARHCDIVLPATTTLERNDFTGSSREGTLLAMHRAVAPVGEARSDHAIFLALARRLGFADAFGEGRDEMAWLRFLYERGRRRAGERGIAMPEFDRFWATGRFDLDPPDEERVFLAAFRADPEGAPLATPSGRIEIYSETVAAFGYDDCPGHPRWLEPAEWLGAAAALRFPLHLVSCQPARRLHSQYDHGQVSLEAKVAGREPVWISPSDAAARGIEEGCVVRLFNDRGACLAGARIGADLRPGVVRLATGAWWDPDRPGEPGALCRHGNANVLTMDVATSRLAQGPSAQTCLVEMERWQGVPPPTGWRRPPRIVARGGVPKARREREKRNDG